MELIAFFLVFLLSWSLTYFVRQYALKKNIIDTPNERSSHTSPTPRGGGISIVVTFYSCLFLIYLLNDLDTSYFIGLLGLISIAIIGFIDDNNHIPARYRLLVHFFAALWSCYWLGIIPLVVNGEQLSIYILWLGTLFYLVWMLNLFNFMDGIDGVASIEAITVCLSAALLMLLDHHDNMIAVLLLALTASLMGFLIWNWPPAKIFMGDVGSAFLGILIASFSLITINSNSLGFLVWLVLLAVFITDATCTLLIRLFRGEKVYEAHRSHAYQHLSRRYGHKLVTISVLAINLLWLFPLAWIGHCYNQFLIYCFLLAYMPLIIFAIKSQAGLPEQCEEI